MTVAKRNERIYPLISPLHIHIYHKNLGFFLDLAFSTTFFYYNGFCIVIVMYNFRNEFKKMNLRK